MTEQVTGTTDWHINADEPDLLDYDTSFKSDAQDAIFAPDPYRASDHDPVVVGLDLTSQAQNPTVLLDALQEKVRNLYYNGTLNRGRTLALLAPLRVAEFQLERGKIRQAERALRRFERFTDFYARRHLLDRETAQMLKEDSQAIRKLL